jgi:hypothetical protein
VPGTWPRTPAGTRSPPTSGELALFELDQLSISQNAGVVDQHVNAAVFLSHVVDPFLHVLAAGDIDLVESSPLPKLLGGLLPYRFVDITDHDLGALLGKALGRRLADSRRAAGNEHHLVFHAHVKHSFRF